MIAPRWKKVFRDIGEAPLRSALAVMAMAAGVFGIGTILTSYSILSRELKITYSSTRPASAILFMENVGDSVVDAVKRVPGVREAEARPMIGGRLRAGERWVPLVLFIIPDFDRVRIDTFQTDRGAAKPADDEILLERSGLSVAGADVGDVVVVRGADGTQRQLKVAGTVHAAGLAPAWMEHAVYGFVGRASLLRAGTNAESSQIRIMVDGNPLDQRHIRDVANRVKTDLRRDGVTVTRIDVPPPGRHPHADQMDTFLFIMGAFGLLTFALGAVLVATMIHALMSEQVRQVGVMKTIGASSAQMIGLYLGQVAILAATSLAVGIPLSLAAGRAYARFAASILNATIVNASPPLWVLATEIAAGILLPLLVSLFPVYRASRITIHEAFSSEAGAHPFGSRRFDRFLSRIAFLPRPMLLSLRTALRRRWRLTLTVATLAAGGVAFISALNVSAAWTRVLDEDARSRRYDIDVVLSQPYPMSALMPILRTVPEIAHAEFWSEAGAILTTAGADPDTRVRVVCPERNSKLLALPLLAGQWLTEGSDSVVINQTLLSRAPGLRVGDKLDLLFRERPVAWRVGGIVREVGGHGMTPTVYAPAGLLRSVTADASDAVRTIRVVTTGHDPGSQMTAVSGIESALSRGRIGVVAIQSLRESRKSFEDHLVIIRSALIFAALLVILVGGLGLTSALMLGVVERTREIGVLSSIGASPAVIAGMIVVEGVLTALASWFLAVIAAIPVTYLLDVFNGRMFVRSPLGFVMSPVAVAAWLVLVVVLSAASSFYPARRASRLAVREALNYE